MNTDLIFYFLMKILSDERIHSFQEILQLVQQQYPEYNFSKSQVHYQLTKLIKNDSSYKRICYGLYQKVYY